MVLRTRENIRVATVFEPGGKIRPVWFEWNRRKLVVKETAYAWRERRGETALLHFAVTDEANLYELVYNTADQTWVLVGVETGETSSP